MNLSGISMSPKGVSLVIASLLLIIIATASSVILYLWVIGFSNPPQEKPVKAMVKVDGYSLLPDGAIVVYVRNIGDAKVDITDTYITDKSGLVLLHKPTLLELDPGEADMVILPAMTIRQEIKPEEGYLIKIYASGGELAVSGKTVIKGSLLQEAARREAPLLGLLAHRSSDPWAKHWVVFDYLSGYYRLYMYVSPGNADLKEKGYAPIVKGKNSYDVCSQKPSSPIVIVVNPTRAQRDWTLEWKCGIGSCYICRFYLQKLQGDIEIDFIVFWEDLYTHPSSSYDDWRDHVIRVTAFFNGTYRLAVLTAKGGYEQEFHLGVDDPLSMPTEPYIYKKPFGAYWANIISGYYHEIPDKVYYVNVRD